MIKVSIKKNNDGYLNIKFHGHAMYDTYGKDIVCAGASSILTTTVNAILKYDNEAIKYDIKKDVLITILKNDKFVLLLLDNMVDLLKELEQNYPKNITIREDGNDE